MIVGKYQIQLFVHYVFCNNTNSIMSKTRSKRDALMQMEFRQEMKIRVYWDSFPIHRIFHIHQYRFCFFQQPPPPPPSHKQHFTFTFEKKSNLTWLQNHLKQN